MRLNAAAALLECRSALVKRRAACHAALGNHRDIAPFFPEIAHTVKKVGSYTSEHGRISLHEAITHRDAATVKALLVAGAKIDAEDFSGATPLDLATDDVCLKILEHHAAVLATITNNPSALVTACARAHGATLSALGQPLNSAVLTLRAHQLDPSFFWVTPAARAAVIAWARDAYIAQQAGTIPLLKNLCDDCAGDALKLIETTMTQTDASLIATHCSSTKACIWVRAVVVAAVVGKAAAELVPATRGDDLASVQDCLSRKANVVIVMNGRTALMETSDFNHTVIFQLLVEAGVDKEAKDENSRTALILASHKGHIESVRFLVEAGADKEAKDEDGCTALILALQEGHLEIVRLLVEAGASKVAKDGRTAHMAASSNGHYAATVRILVGAVTDRKFKDHFGRTALTLASQEGHTKLVEALVEAGADKELKDKNGCTALMHASSNGHAATVRILVEAGADKEA